MPRIINWRGTNRGNWHGEKKMFDDKNVLVFGSTGNIGGAVTRTPDSTKVQALAELGAEVVQEEMDDRASLDKVFTGMRRVFSVQNWATSGVEGEIRQGKLVFAQGMQALDQIVQDSRRLNPEMHNLESWLKVKQNGTKTHR